jgi:hypothetical protein
MSAYYYVIHKNDLKFVCCKIEETKEAIYVARDKFINTFSIYVWEEEFFRCSGPERIFVFNNNNSLNFFLLLVLSNCVYCKSV